MTLTVLKISHLEQLNSKIFAWLSNIFSRLKIEHLIKQIGITCEAFMCGNIHDQSVGWEYENGIQVSKVINGKNTKITVNGISGFEVPPVDNYNGFCVANVSGTVVYCVKGLSGWDNLSK
ncbi:hypothetical protein [Pseudoalteromonas rubra]|uniref:Uncharacterized protein n=1 Tax=Pseudoalteromonas rubra TaxID=43658 RepID=A0A5S3X2C9_9GAMM|nr:hypothetical protein [Pseudoalteromonas rubra]TMP37880.1 hypothetical protein CWB98_07945 [Pseudoalteromonas rubra]